MLDLATAPVAGPVADWLASRPLTRSVGAVYSAERAEEYLEAADPRRFYNALAFMETTTAARAMETGRRSNLPKRVLATAATNLELAGSGNVPDGWEWSGSRRAYTHRVELTDGLSPSGGRSVSIARASAPWRWGQGRLEQTFDAEAWRGKRLRFCGAVRTEGPGTGAQLYVGVQPKPPEGGPSMMPPIAMGMVERPVRLSHWATHTAEIDVPEGAAAITIGLALAGNGVAWFGDLELAF